MDEKLAREYLKLAHEKLSWMFTKDGNRQFFRQCLAMQPPDFLLRAAREGDAEAIDFLREYGREARRTGANVPEVMHQFVWDYFLDGKPRAKSGSSSKDNDLRKQCLAILVKHIHEEFRFPIYRNPEYRGENEGPMTAPRLVGEEFGLSERTIEEIWADRKAGIEAASAVAL